MPFFSGSITELDINKVNFLHYLVFYNRIYDLEEEQRPSQEVIQNRYLCDEWLRVFMAELNRERRKLRGGPSRGGRSSSMEVDF